eukprot:TRINITY_DN56349_c0_g1_i1.p1 TRINITY_DN56349_c0_g1~~TRINITY_DN56349_c0_g1_i1.p1  ORF type:complete len:425 (+),score=23.23 TRINITY_DN56349_c0_g1_i1:105-1379(+)
MGCAVNRLVREPDLAAVRPIPRVTSSGAQEFDAVLSPTSGGFRSVLSSGDPDDSTSVPLSATVAVTMVSPTSEPCVLSEDRAEELSDAGEHTHADWFGTDDVQRTVSLTGAKRRAACVGEDMTEEVRNKKPTSVGMIIKQSNSGKLDRAGSGLYCGRQRRRRFQAINSTPQLPEGSRSPSESSSRSPASTRGSLCSQSSGRSPPRRPRLSVSGSVRSARSVATDVSELTQPTPPAYSGEDCGALAPSPPGHVPQLAGTASPRLRQMAGAPKPAQLACGLPQSRRLHSSASQSGVQQTTSSTLSTSSSLPLWTDTKVGTDSSLQHLGCPTPARQSAHSAGQESGWTTSGDAPSSGLVDLLHPRPSVGSSEAPSVLLRSTPSGNDVRTRDGVHAAESFPGGQTEWIPLPPPPDRHRLSPRPPPDSG